MRPLLVLGLLFVASSAHADLTHESVSGTPIARVDLDGAPATWSSLATPKKPGLYTLRFEADGAVGIPHCNGRERVLVDDAVRDPGSKGPLVLGLTGRHRIAIEVRASTYEKRVACSGPPIFGAAVPATDGLSRMRFTSPAKGGGEAVVFVPGGHDRARPATVLVGTHPWNGSTWTYAAYEELLDEAGKKDVVLLMPSGLGNSLYVAEAEAEVMRALDALGAELAVDPQRVSIWGASMGGAGATTIAFHRPDRFAFVASYFGDSRYDLTTYVKGILGGEEGARRVNALDVLENARHLPVLLVHGEDDRTSPIRQSTMLYDAMKAAGFDVTFVREPHMGHEGPLVVKHVRTVVDRAAVAVAPRRPSRVTFRSVRPDDVAAYGVRLEKSGREAFVDVERVEDRIVVKTATGVRALRFARDAFGVAAPLPVTSPVPTTWEP